MAEGVEPCRRCTAKDGCACYLIIKVQERLNAYALTIRSRGCLVDLRSLDGCKAGQLDVETIKSGRRKAEGTRRRFVPESPPRDLGSQDPYIAGISSCLHVLNDCINDLGPAVRRSLSDALSHSTCSSRPKGAAVLPTNLQNHTAELHLTQVVFSEHISSRCTLRQRQQTFLSSHQ